MRAISFVLVFLLGMEMRAGERPVRSPETLLGDAAHAPLYADFLRHVETATNGDSSIAVWSVDYALFAQTIDRDGKLVAPYPKMLAEVPLSDQTPGNFFTHVLWIDGLYAIFFQSDHEPMTLMRVTENLEIVDRRVVDLPPFAEIVEAGDELLIELPDRVLRLRRDFTLIASVPHERRNAALVPSERGTMVVISAAPAITVWPLDGAVSGVRIASADSPRGVHMVWTGTEYLVVWAECSYGCSARMVRLDARLQPIGAAMEIGSGSDFFEIRVTSDDTVFLVWRNRYYQSLGRWMRRGTVIGRDVDLGDDASTVLTSLGRIIAVSRELETRIVPPAGANTSTYLDPVARAETAARETVSSVAASATQVAIARQRAGTAANLVSIVDANGVLVREVRLHDGGRVALASDGVDFYAVITSDYAAWFQKVDGKSSSMELPYPVVPVLRWTGDTFVTLSDGSGWVGRQWISRTFVRWLDRNGAFHDRRCAAGIIPTTTERADIVTANDVAYVITPAYWMRLKNGCPDGDAVRVQSDMPKLAWREGTWASLTFASYPPLFSLRLSSDPMVFDGRAHNAGVAIGNAWRDAVITALPSRWLTGYASLSGLRIAVFDENGSLSGSTVIAERGGRVDAIAPIGPDRAIAVYTRPVFEPPYSGTWRVFAAPITFESASRRRGVTP